jgi:hypothetical protein
MMHFAPFAVLWAAPAVTVVGSSECPSPAEVAVQLAPLLPASAMVPNIALLETRGSSVHIVLSSSDGDRIGERQLERSGTCDELAAAAAVVIATWQTAVRREFVTPLPSPPAGQAHASRKPASSPAATKRMEGEVDVGLGMSFDMVGHAAAGALGIWLAPAGFWGGLRVSAMLSGWRQEELGEGHLRWTRWALLLGPEARLLAGPAVASVRLQAAFGILRLTGGGFEENRSHQAPALAVGSGLRVALRSVGWRPWIGLEGLFWPRAETAGEIPGGSTFRIPRWQMVLGGGVAVGW